jgi:DUF4097 and DUF4098 domain-containing protein YvlB
MATVPPPYSQRDAARAQRYYQRSLRRPSMVSPVVLIVVGVLALLVETNTLSFVRVWDWYMHWWPLLLVGVGLLSLGEWYLDRERGYLGRRSHGGLIALIIVFAVVGYMAGTASRGLHGMHVFRHDSDQDDFFSRLLGQEHDDDRSLNQSIPTGAPVDIRVPHGDVTVSPSGDDQIHVQAHLVVYAANDRSARRSLEALAPQLVVNGGSVTLRTTDAGNGRADLTVEIPKGSIPTVTANHGDVTLEGLAGSVNVYADHGDVKADNVRGAVHARMGKGDFTVHAIAGDVSLQGRLDDVSISEVQGRVALDGDFFGDTSLAHIDAPVHFHSSRTDVQVISIAGALTIDSGDLALNDATGPVRISTSAKDVECTGITGDLRVDDGDGDISVGALAPLGEIGVHNRNGAINLTVPRGAGFELQATAKNGDIESKLDLPITSTGQGHTIAGTVGKGGPRVELAADHGDIEITTTDMAPSPPAPPSGPAVPDLPSPPSPPSPPGSGQKPIRHLHPAKGASAEPVVQ